MKISFKFCLWYQAPTSTINCPSFNFFSLHQFLRIEGIRTPTWNNKRTLRKLNIEVNKLTELTRTQSEKTKKQSNNKRITCNSDRRIVILGLNLRIGLRNQTFLHSLTERACHLNSSDSNVQFFDILVCFWAYNRGLVLTLHCQTRAGAIRYRSNVRERDIAASTAEIEEQERNPYTNGGEVAVLPFSLTEHIWEFSSKAWTRYMHSWGLSFPFLLTLTGCFWFGSCGSGWREKKRRENDKLLRMTRPSVCCPMCLNKQRALLSMGIWSWAPMIYLYRPSEISPAIFLMIKI